MPPSGSTRAGRDRGRGNGLAIFGLIALLLALLLFLPVFSGVRETVGVPSGQTIIQQVFGGGPGDIFAGDDDNTFTVKVNAQISNWNCLGPTDLINATVDGTLYSFEEQNTTATSPNVRELKHLNWTGFLGQSHIIFVDIPSVGQTDTRAFFHVINAEKFNMKLDGC